LKVKETNLSALGKNLVAILFSWKEGLRVNFKVADDRVSKILDLATALAKQHSEKRVGVFAEM